MTEYELSVWRSLLDTTDDLRRVLTAQLQESGVSSGDYRVLLALSEAREHRLRSSELAAGIDWERSRLSHHLGRMERRGLIRRDDCATDNRGAEVVLTDEGAEAFRRAGRPHLRAIKRVFADALSAQQFEALDDILTTLRKHMEATT
ncbi:MarR family transcriptional regulator [Actinocrispum sp. NPDC049592]|uniref:MarR family winged helix-turn-helix transcriptional regulator n=1 Tax=Actinocrispum sp. NPDC049592 TaxID=3154835 RepID=UPI00343451B2